MRAYLLLTLLSVVAAKKQIIAIMGAGGQQGGALVDAILEDDTFKCRALTRNPESEKAKALAGRGCEVVEADLEKPDTLKQAFKGAHGVFIITNFLEIHDGEKEYQQAKVAADVASGAGVKHIVWSTLEATQEHDTFLNVIPAIGNFKVPHFDGKSKATHYMKSKLYPVTYLYTAFYMDNFHVYHMLSRKDDSNYEIVLPTLKGTKIPMVSVRDIGLAALDAFKNSAETINQDVKVIGDLLSPKEIAAKLEKASGVTVTAKEPTPEEFAQFGFPSARDLGNMFLYFSEYQDVWKTYHPVKKHENFEAFCKRNAKVLQGYVSKANAGVGTKADL